jgi:hypothetical protein
MAFSIIGECLDIGLPNEVAGYPDEPVGVEVEREIAHAFLKGTPDDVYDGLRVAPCRVLDVEDVADTSHEGIVVRSDAGDVLIHRRLGADRDASSRRHFEVDVDSRLGMQHAVAVVAFTVGHCTIRDLVGDGANHSV